MKSSLEPVAAYEIRQPARLRLTWRVGVSVVLVASFFFCYANVIGSLASKWFSNDAYSYGPLIPLISLYLAWQRRKTLAQMSPQPQWISGMMLLAAAFSMLIVGQVGAISILQEVSIILSVAGMILFLFGWQFLKVLSWSVGYLVFMMPVWGNLVEPLQRPFQFFTASIGAFLLQLIGIPVYLDTVYIHLPNIVLEVADVCSGVNYLVAVIAISIPMAVLFLESWTKRIILMVFAATVAAFSNSIRVALIGVLAYYKIGGDLHGPNHILQGLFVSFVGYGAIFVGLWWLSGNSSDQMASGRTTVMVPPATESSPGRVGNPLFLSLVFVVVGGFVKLSQPVPILLEKPLHDFPTMTGEWVAQASRPGGATSYRNPDADDELSRTYRNAAGDAVDLYIGYHMAQDPRKKVLDYRTLALYDRSIAYPLSRPVGGLTELSRVIEVSENNDKRLVLVGYYIAGKPFANWYKAKAYGLWSAAVQRRSDGAVVIVTTEFADESDLVRAQRSIEALLQALNVPLGELLSR